MFSQIHILHLQNGPKPAKMEKLKLTSSVRGNDVLNSIHKQDGMRHEGLALR